MATIVEAIKAVLTEHPNGLTSAEIYNSIMAKELYSFKAENPYANSKWYGKTALLWIGFSNSKSP